MAKSKEARYTVGIDLGTTNSVLSYVDHKADKPLPQPFLIPQIVAPGEIQALPSLPSFIYMPMDAEAEKGIYNLPWNKENPELVVGTMARDKAAEAPDRVVFSSKSWLCCDRIDRRSPCLPPDNGGEDNVTRISPVDAAKAILEHIRDAWNFTMAKNDPSLRLEKQPAVITVPASFDAVARDLTVEAAKAAGLDFTLLEEPQAAFYAWLAEHDKDWRNKVADGDVVLVCDIGGGTTDFSLIAVTDNGGGLELQRLAVGNHTLLGGDNMDITLAMAVAKKLAAEKHVNLSSYQMTALIHACRKAKEALGNGAQGAQPLTILGRGSSLLAASITTSISEEDLKEALLEGFFPFCPIDASVFSAKRTGLRSFSLDYAADPAFTRHLAQFLEKHSFKDGDGKPILPGTVLFNGGVTKAPVFSQRLLSVLQAWRGADCPPTLVLTQEDPDLSVAKGAAWFAHVKQCGGIRIKAGSARSYYIGIESPMPAVPGFPPPLDALCVVNHGMEEGTEQAIKARGLALVVGEDSDFRFFTSTTHTADKAGTRLKEWQDGELAELPTLTVNLPIDKSKGDNPGSLVAVNLRSVLSDIGTLQLWCDEANGDRHWKLEFELRDNEAAGTLE